MHATAAAAAAVGDDDDVVDWKNASSDAHITAIRKREDFGCVVITALLVTNGL